MPKVPRISIVIPTLNAGKVLNNCLTSIRYQSYDQNQIEIIVADGGSTDDTLKIAQNHHCKIFKNPLKTGESGKAVGVKNSTGKYIALIDSDNILPDRDWLRKSISPLENNPQIFGSEPWAYTYRKEGGYIERYAALTGINDPFILIAKNYDRYSYLTNKWTGIKLKTTDYKDYILIKFNQESDIPTIGANGTIYRKSMLNQVFKGDYLVDIDIIKLAINKYNSLLFAKTKQGIIHTFCESSVLKFVRKQNRRVTDYYIYKDTREDISNSVNLTSKLKFIFYVTLVIPMLVDTIKGLLKKTDPAWLFHPIACIITLSCYGIGTIKYNLGILKPIKREKWSQ